MGKIIIEIPQAGTRNYRLKTGRDAQDVINLLESKLREVKINGAVDENEVLAKRASNEIDYPTSADLPDDEEYTPEEWKLIKASQRFMKAMDREDELYGTFREQKKADENCENTQSLNSPEMMRAYRALWQKLDERKSKK